MDIINLVIGILSILLMIVIFIVITVYAKSLMTNVPQFSKAMNGLMIGAFVVMSFEILVAARLIYCSVDQ